MRAFRRRPDLDEEVVDTMRNVLTTESDRDLREQAAKVLAYQAIAALPSSPDRHARFVEAVESLLRT